MPNIIKRLLAKQELATIQTKLYHQQEIYYAVDCLVQSLPPDRMLIVLNSALVLADNLKKTKSYVFRPNIYDYPEIEYRYCHKENKIIINK